MAYSKRIPHIRFNTWPTLCRLHFQKRFSKELNLVPRFKYITMHWFRQRYGAKTGAKPLPEPMVTQSIDAYMCSYAWWEWIILNQDFDSSQNWLLMKLCNYAYSHKQNYSQILYQHFPMSNIYPRVGFPATKSFIYLWFHLWQVWNLRMTDTQFRPTFLDKVPEW